MANQPQPTKSGTSIKGPLTFAFVAGLVAGVITTVATAGGVIHGLRFDLGAIAFGVAFIATLVVASLLVMGHKENPEDMGQGSGVNLRSADRLEAVKRAAAEAQKASSSDNAEGAAPAAESTDSANKDDAGK